MTFYRKCAGYAAESLGQLSEFSHMCTETLYGPGGQACDAHYMELAQHDIALACGCAAPGECGQCSAPCAAMFETVYTRCGDFIAASGAGDQWAAFQAQCQEQAGGDGPPAGGTCEEQCAALYPNEDEEPNACACTYGCHAMESGQDAESCLATCDTRCDDDDECECQCGSAHTCEQCTSEDECEAPCGVGCSLMTETDDGAASSAFSGLEIGSAAMLDAAEEAIADGSMYCSGAHSCEVEHTSSDLELMSDDGVEGKEQMVGIRFGPVNIPQGAKIMNAHVSFVIDEVSELADTPITIAIFAEATDNSVAITGNPFDLSSRLPTETSRIWQPPRATDPASEDFSLCWEVNRCGASIWSVVGAAVQSPNIASVLQEVVSRPGWTAGNSLMVLFAQLADTGCRTLESGQEFIQLHYEFDVTPPPELPPTAECGGQGDGLHGSPTCETAYSGSSCSECPFGSEAETDLVPEGWTHGAASRCTIPEGAVLLGGTRICYCHGNVAAEGLRDDVAPNDLARQSCAEFGTEWFRNCKMVMLSRFVALCVSLTPEASLLQTRAAITRMPAGSS